MIDRLDAAGGEGFAAEHPTERALPVLVAPSTSPGEFNAIRFAHVPFACWCIGDVRFEFASSFLQPEVAKETPLLARLLRKHAEGGVRPALSIFGHADPVGVALEVFQADHGLAGAGPAVPPPRAPGSRRAS